MSTIIPTTATGNHTRSGPGPEVQAAMDLSVTQARSRTRRRRIAIVITQLAIVVIFLGAWELAANNGVLKNAPLFYGSPSGIVESITKNWAKLLASLGSTLYAAFLGFAVGVIAALLVGVLLSQVSFLNRVVDPFVVVLTGLPRIALAPLFVLWFGIGDTSKIALSVSLVFFIVLINVLAGFRSVDKDLIIMAKSFGASRGDTVRKVALPSSIPILFAGLRLGLVFSILGVIAMEMTAARSGLGLDVVRYAQGFQPDGVFSVLVVLAATMALLNWGLSLLEKRLQRWAPDR